MPADEPDPQAESQPGPMPTGGFGRTRYGRESWGLEFDRVSFFCDAVYAIALTLIAVELKPPVLEHAGEARALLDGLGEMKGEFVAFFIVFAVVGNYWISHHRFMGWLRAVDGGFIGLTIAYLAFVAFIPFPAATMGQYLTNPAAVGLFAVVMAAVSLLEWVLFRHAYGHGLLAAPMSDRAFRWASIGSLMPVALFLLSVPVMFISTWLGMAVWFGNIVVGAVLARSQPEEFTAA